MTRLPTPGSDDNTWGDLLNEFLSIDHNSDGTHIISHLVDTDATLATNSDNRIASQKATKTYVDAALGASNAVHLTGNETVAGVKTFISQLNLQSNIPTLDFKTTQSGTREWKLAGAYNDPNSLSLVDVTASNAQRLLIDASGRVGIGKTNPTAASLLDVNGDVYALGLHAPVFDKGGQVYNVKNYGAVADGSTNDTPAFNTAITAAFNAGGGQVFVPAGTYAITGLINLKDDVSLVGSGTSSKLVLAHLAHINIDLVSNVSVRELQTDGVAQLANDFTIYVGNSTNVLIERCRVKDTVGFGIFINATGGQTCQQVWVKNCTLNGRGTCDVIGGGPADSTGSIVRDVFILDNHIIQDATVGTNYGAAIDLVAPYRYRFSGNITEGHIVFGSEQYPHKFSLITDNIIKPAAGLSYAALGLIVDPGSGVAGQAVLIANNVIESGFIDFYSNPSSSLFGTSVITGNVINAGGVTRANGTAGIRVVHLDKGLISGNKVYNSPADGIWLTHVTNTSVIGNSVSDSTQVGIYETGSSDNNYVTDNQLSGNGGGALSLVGAADIHLNNPGAADMSPTDSTVLHTTGNETKTGNLTLTNITTTVDVSAGGVYKSTSQVGHYLGRSSALGDAALTIARTTGEGDPTVNAGTIVLFQNNSGSGFSGQVDIVTGTAGSASLGFGDKDNPSAGSILWNNSTNKFWLSGGNLGIGVNGATAQVDVAASTTSSASLRVRSGTAPTSPNDGDVWYDGSHLRFRASAVTYQLDNQSGTVAFTSKSISYILTASDNTVAADATSGAVTITLPTASGIAGRQYTVKRINAGANNVTVAANGAETIDGATTQVLTIQYVSITVVSDGTNWLII